MLLIRHLTDRGSFCFQKANMELIEEITYNSDNIDDGEMIHIDDGSEDGMTGFTDRGIECIEELLRDARGRKGGLRSFLIAEHCDPETIERIMAKNRLETKPTTISRHKIYSSDAYE